MLLPTAGMMIFWNRIQELTNASMKFFLGS
jgi:hypothetical protein